MHGAKTYGTVEETKFFGGLDMNDITLGYKINISTFDELDEHARKWRADIRELTRDAVTRTCANLALNALFLSRIDAAERPLFGEMYQLFKEEYPSHRAGSYMTAYSAMQHAEQRIEQEGRLEPTFDFKSELIIFPYEGQLLGMLFTVNPNVLAYFEAHPLFTEYSYTQEKLNELDPDEAIRRRNAWHTVLSENRVPMLDGFRVSFYTSLPLIYTPDVVEYINKEMNVLVIIEKYADRISKHRGSEKQRVLMELLEVLPVDITSDTLNQPIEL